MIPKRPQGIRYIRDVNGDVFEKQANPNNYLTGKVHDQMEEAGDGTVMCSPLSTRRHLSLLNDVKLTLDICPPAVYCDKWQIK